MRRTKVVSDIEIDEVSLVDKPANQHAEIAIAKRATEEETVPEIYNEDGNAVEMDDLQFGDVVFDQEGNAFEVIPEAEELEYEEELEPVGKSLADEIREDLSKAAGDAERDVVIAKAMQEVDALRGQLVQAESIAKSERDLRLTAEYVEVAKGYNIPVNPEDLGPVLLRMAETMSDQDCSVIHKALSTSGAALFDEVGYIGTADNVDPLSQVDAYLEEGLSKSDGTISKAEAMSGFFSDNPAAYDEYLASRRGF